MKMVIDPSKSNDSKTLANHLINQIIQNSDQLFSLKNTGNYGLALSDILKADLVNDPEIENSTILACYWAITNHIENDNQNFLLFKRAVILCTNLDIFNKILYDLTLETFKKFNPGLTELSSFDTESIENTVKELILSDLDSVKDCFDYAKNMYSELSNMFQLYLKISLFPVNCAEMHQELKKYIQFTILK